MTLLRNTVTEPDGSPLNGWLDVAIVGNPFQSATQSEVLGPIKDRQITGGAWSVDLAPGLYAVTQRRRDGAFHSRWTVEVPDSESAVWLADCLVAAPSSPASVALRAVTSTVVDEGGHLQVTYSDGVMVDAGPVVGPQGPPWTGSAAEFGQAVADEIDDETSAVNESLRAASVAAARDSGAFAPALATRASPQAARWSEQPLPRAMVALIFDDGWSDHMDAATAIEANGGRATFAINSGALNTTDRLTSAQTLDLHQRGHCVVGHSRTHTDMTTQTVADRVSEYGVIDDLEAIIGAGNARAAWVFPFNTQNDGLLQECYGRVGRTLGGGGNNNYTRPISDRGGSALACGRLSWFDASHQQVLHAIRRAAQRDEVLVIFTHRVNGAGMTNGISTAELTEGLGLIASLGLPMVRIDEALPAYNPLGDPLFEDTALGAWDLTVSTGATYASVLRTSTGDGAIETSPGTYQAAIPGARCLQITGDGTHGGVSARSLYVPVEPGVEYNAQVIAGSNRTGGAGSTAMSVEVFDKNHQSLGIVLGEGLATGNSIRRWQLLRTAFVAPPGADHAQVRCTQGAGFIGQSWFTQAVLERAGRGFVAQPWKPGYLSIAAATTLPLSVVGTGLAGFVDSTAAAAITVTIPPSSSAPFPLNARIRIRQSGAGQVTIAAGSGVTLTGAGLKTAAQYAVAELVKTGTDAWAVFGNVVA